MGSKLNCLLQTDQIILIILGNIRIKKLAKKDAFDCELPFWLSQKWFIGIQDVSAVSVLVWELALKSTRFRLAFFWLIRPAPCRPPQMCLKQKPVSSCVCRLCTVSRHWQNLLHRKHKVSKILWYFDSLSLSNPCPQPLSDSSRLPLSSTLKQRRNFLKICYFLQYSKFYPLWLTPVDSQSTQ